MKPSQLCIWSVLSVVLFTFTAHAQFYAPDTEYHDKVQRLFIVELARVLAWRENSQSQKAHEITYKVEVKSGTTTWEVQWLNAEGKPWHHTKISYEESLLLEGPRFYREVFKQIWFNGKWSQLPKISAQELTRRFWNGAGQAGMSREEGLTAVFKIIGTNASISESEYAPALAGSMSHVPLPSLCGGVTLDAMLLARAAAWLCLSEAMLDKAESVRDELWSPIMFLAGRENAAFELWKKSVKEQQQMTGKPPLFAWWRFFLQQPTAKEAFIFATDPNQRPFAMPMLTYYARVRGLGSTLAELFYPLYGDRRNTLFRLHNYGPFLATTTGIGGGRILEGMWPALFRAAWADMLKEFKPAPLDYTDYQQKLKEVSRTVLTRQTDEEDGSLVGLKAATPLIELGYEQGEGKLIPLATVTSRDLLNYGWEMNSLQMGSRYIFVNDRWGIDDLAETVFREATRDIQGQAPFFKNKFQKSVFNLQTNLFRLQMVDDLGGRVAVDIQPFSKDLYDTNTARLFYKRCWLRPYEVRWQAWTLCWAGLRDEMVQLLDRYHRECGPKSDVITLEYLLALFSKDQLKQVKGLPELKASIAASLPEPTNLKFRTYYSDQFIDMSNLERARALEKLFWQNPDSGLEERVITTYIASGSFNSAKRFYRQIRDILSLEVGFSNNTGPQLWAIGYLQDDENLMKTALNDSNTGSYRAMLLAFWNAAMHEDTKGMEHQMEELIERYEARDGSQSTGRMLKGFIPLIPALKNPKDPDHQKALDYFGKAETGLTLRTLLILKYQLSTDDAVRFLGGKETDRFRRVVILSLLKDAEKLPDAYNDFNQNTTTDVSWVIANWMRLKLLNLPIEADKDLKITDAKPIRAAVLEKLAEK